MNHRTILSLILALLFALPALDAAAAEAGEAAPLPTTPCARGGFGFLAQTDRAVYAPGELLTAYFALYNYSCEELAGYLAQGGEGCAYQIDLLDAMGRSVHRSLAICPLLDSYMIPEGERFADANPAAPEPLPHGDRIDGVHQFELSYRNSETGAKDGEPLPPGDYLLRAELRWNGPVVDPNPYQGAGAGTAGHPGAEVPIHIAESEETPEWSLLQPINVDRGEISHYGYDRPDFAGEDLVIRDPAEWLAFWGQHTGDGGAAIPLPEIDFSTRMVLVTVMGLQESGGGPATRITQILGGDDRIRVQVIDDTTPGMLALVTNPYHIVAVPSSPLPVDFQHRTNNRQDDGVWF